MTNTSLQDVHFYAFALHNFYCVSVKPRAQISTIFLRICEAH